MQLNKETKSEKNPKRIGKENNKITLYFLSRIYLKKTKMEQKSINERSMPTISLLETEGCW